METIIQQNETDAGKHNAPMIPDEIKKEIRNYFLTAASKGYKVSMNIEDSNEHPVYNCLVMSATDDKGTPVFISGKRFVVNLCQVIPIHETTIHVHCYENIPFGSKSWHVMFDGSEKEWVNNLLTECKWIAE